MSNAIKASDVLDVKPFTQGSETAVRLMLRYPWFMVLYYSMRFYDTVVIPTLATNGVGVWVNPNFWRQLSRDEKMTAVAHELGHKMLLHTTRRGERCPERWNRAGDYVINLMLVESKFQPLAGLKIDGHPWNWWYDLKYKGWTTEAVYDDLTKQDEEQADQENGEQAGQGSHGQSGQAGTVPSPSRNAGDVAKDKMGAEADLVDFGTTPEGIPNDSHAEGSGSVESVGGFEQRVRKELKQAEAMSKSQGMEPAWMKRVIGNADHAHVPWYEVFEQHMKARCVADYSWHRFNRREFVKCGVISPDLYTPAMGGMKVYVDVSGSISAHELNKFNGHFKDIVQEVKPAWVDVHYFHCYVQHHLDQHFERGDFDVELKPGGSGGTSFAWLQDELDECPEQPDVVVFLTDMMGTFGREVDVATYWLSSSHIETAPFGEVIQIN